MHSHEIFHRPPKLCISLRASAGFSPAFRRKSPRPRIRGGPLAFRSRQKGVNYCGAAILAAAVKERPTARGHASGPISRRQQPLGSQQPSDFQFSIFHSFGRTANVRPPLQEWAREFAQDHSEKPRNASRHRAFSVARSKNGLAFSQRGGIISFPVVLPRRSARRGH